MLVKVVLTGLAVYWLTLARIPQSILKFLRHAIFNFLWGISSGKSKIHLVDFNLLRPRNSQATTARDSPQSTFPTSPLTFWYRESVRFAVWLP